MLWPEYVTDDLEDDESEKEHNKFIPNNGETREEVKIEPTCTVSSAEKKRGIRKWGVEGGQSIRRYFSPREDWQRSPVILGAECVPCSLLSS